MNLGDSPSFLMNALGSNMIEIFGGQSYPIIFGIVIFCILAYLALAYRLDRGALAFLGIFGLGIMVMEDASGLMAIDPAVWVVGILLVGAVGAYGVLNSMRQGAV